MIEGLDAPLAAAPAVLDGLGAANSEAGDVPGSGSPGNDGACHGQGRLAESRHRPPIDGTVAGASQGRAIAVDEYAKGSEWAMGVAACARALVGDDEVATEILAKR